MSVIYHGVPREMVGDVIYPLSQLATIDATRYAFQRSKYAGREAALDFRVPHLDLLLTETVHCACLHPYHLYSARRAVGLDPARRPINRPETPSWVTGHAFEIPVERISGQRAVWYSAQTPWINGAPNEDVPPTPPPGEFEPFDPDRYRPLAAATPAHVEYLRRPEGPWRTPAHVRPHPAYPRRRPDQHQRPAHRLLGRTTEERRGGSLPGQGRSTTGADKRLRVGQTCGRVGARTAVGARDYDICIRKRATARSAPRESSGPTSSQPTAKEVPPPTRAFWPCPPRHLGCPVAWQS
jgi:hypothetical protein